MPRCAKCVDRGIGAGALKKPKLGRPCANWPQWQRARYSDRGVGSGADAHVSNERRSGMRVKAQDDPALQPTPRRRSGRWQGRRAERSAIPRPDRKNRRGLQLLRPHAIHGSPGVASAYPVGEDTVRPPTLRCRRQIPVNATGPLQVDYIRTKDHARSLEASASYRDAAC